MSEDQEQFGVESYEAIFRQIIQDLGISRMVESFRILVRPEEPYFLISLRTGKARGALKIQEVAHLDGHTGGTMLTIIDETYAPALLVRLWQRYGRDRVEQLTRFELLVRGASVEDLLSMELDPGEELRAKLLDAVWRLFPEGFKVRHNIIDEKVMTILGTEHEMKKEWIELAERVHREMGAR